MTIEELLMVMSGDLGWLIFMTVINMVILCVAVFVMVYIIGRLEDRIVRLEHSIRNRH